jgi:hypothetical protein
MSTTPGPNPDEDGAPYNAWRDAYADDLPPTAGPPERQRRPGAALRMAALVAAAAAAGGTVTYVVSHDSSTGPTASVASSGQAGTQQQGGVPQQGGQPPGGFGPGGVDGEQRVTGTLAEVSGSTISIATPSGSETYTVSAATEISRDGAQASLSDLVTGETVQVHLIPASSDSSSSADLVVERVIAGSGGFGPGVRGPDDGDSHDDDSDDGVGTSSGSSLDT